MLLHASIYFYRILRQCGGMVDTQPHGQLDLVKIGCSSWSEKAGMASGTHGGGGGVGGGEQRPTPRSPLERMGCSFMSSI